MPNRSSCEPPTLVIKACPEAVKEARDFVALVFGGWGVEDFVARVVVSELATNAIRHGAREGDVVVVRVFRRDETHAVIEVWDRGVESPELQPENHTAESGRGLLLMDQLVVRWGVRPLSEGGKVVWAEIECVPL
ncbi:ATP-binding protein [Actinomadura rugatobispora]|uniref:ATP-binding protein n=1 Tax=Actinomadura rugatobispora TaxID=1994 RepID=A0ABW1A6H1_9ACTN|nr:ATP-binding protein [Actinomadura rugatobispora]